jgi:hypothetical protein
LEEARRAGRPVALLVSRRACPRCRSLEEAALSDPRVAAVLEGRFVAAGLDPEQRPDLARGLEDALLLLPLPRPLPDPGLPRVIVTTPELRILDGTALVREGRPLGPALLDFLVRLADAWDADRSGLEARAGLVTAALREAQAARPLPSLGPALLERPLAGLREAFDRRHGGFGVAPRRVPHGALRLLLEEHARTGEASLLSLVTATLDAVLASPLRDASGGFFREAMGEDWTLPVRERTLADNSLLLGALVSAHEATGRSAYAEAAAGIAGFVEKDLRDAAGGFQHAVADGPSGELRDERVFAYANGLAVSGLARAGKALARAEDLRAAAAAADRVLARLGPARSLARFAEGGERHGPSLLEDYAFLAEGLLDLHQATGGDRWRSEARSLLDAAVGLFGDPVAFGFFESAEDGELRPARRRDAYDGPLPSANAVMASALRRLGRATGETMYVELSRRTVLAFASDLPRTPRGLETLASVVGEIVGPVSGPPAGAAGALPRASRGPVAFEATVEPAALRPGRPAKVAVRIEVAPGARVIAHRPFPAPGPARREARDVSPLALAFPEAPFRVGPPQYPDGAPSALPGGPASVLAHVGTVTVTAPLTVPREAPAAEKRLRVRVVYQVCDARRCEAPESVLLEAPFRVEP